MASFVAIFEAYFFPLFNVVTLAREIRFIVSFKQSKPSETFTQCRNNDVRVTRPGLLYGQEKASEYSVLLLTFVNRRKCNESQKTSLNTSLQMTGNFSGANYY